MGQGGSATDSATPPVVCPDAEVPTVVDDAAGVVVVAEFEVPEPHAASVNATTHTTEKIIRLVMRSTLHLCLLGEDAPALSPVAHLDVDTIPEPMVLKSPTKSVV